MTVYLYVLRLIPKFQLVSSSIPFPYFWIKIQTSADSALAQFFATADWLIQFEATLNAPGATPTLSACKIRRDHFNSLWQTVKAAYDICSDSIIAAGESVADTKPILNPNVLHLWNVCRAADGTNPKRFLPNSTSSSNSVPKFHVLWQSAPSYRPTFRDLFTAIYIDNTSLTPVEKLLHLNSKRSAEAHSIVSRSPLTNDGFRSAWKNLTERVENKRCSHLKTLFNVQSITQESGAAL